MKTIHSLREVQYDERFLELSWIWLGDEEIRCLTMTPPFTKIQQRTWFDSLANRKDYLIWGIELDNLPIGAFGIKHIDNISGEYWGYIGEKKYWGQGIGHWMVKNAIAFAKDLGLQRLWLRVSLENTRAMKLYVKCGFMTVRNEDGVKWMEIGV
jgi:RimJ/RimL family protein N-acetyltransferase